MRTTAWLTAEYDTLINPTRRQAIPAVRLIHTQRPCHARLYRTLPSPSQKLCLMSRRDPNAFSAFRP